MQNPKPETTLSDDMNPTWWRGWRGMRGRVLARRAWQARQAAGPWWF